MRPKSLTVIVGFAVLFAPHNAFAQSPSAEKPEVGSRQTREYLLESIVAPDKAIAKDFETVVIVTTDGLAHTGVLKSEDDRQLTLITAEAKLIVIPKEQIEERARGPSSMPDTLVKYLTKSELRDVTEFLAERK